MVSAATSQAISNGLKNDQRILSAIMFLASVGRCFIRWANFIEHLMVKRILVCAFFLLLASCNQSPQNLPAERVREFANVLYNRDLYKQAIAEYERYLHDYALEEREQANVSYTIANIYFDRVRDYESALAYYLRVQQLYPKSELVDQAGKRIVECLERLQRSADAQQALEERTFLDTTQVAKKRPGVVVAKIGDREITSGDLDFEMKRLPPYIQAQIKDKSKRVEFLRQYIATELLYDTAKRKGLEKNPEVVEAAFQAKKSLVVQKLLEEEIAGKPDFNDSDLDLYYRANQSRYTKTDSSGKSQPLAFAEAKAQVTQDFIRDKQQQKYTELVERMMRAESVQIYDDKVQ
jgi:peptidyl-prolyl cis-trans isomerase C